MCGHHDLPLYAQTVQLISGTLAEGWFCPMWHEHSTPPPHPVTHQVFPDVERITDRIPQPRPTHIYNQARRTGAGVNTSVQQAMRPAPKLTRNLNKWKQEQGE